MAVCTRCRTALDSNIAEHKSRPVCLDCKAFYEDKKCAQCQEGAASAVSALGKRWHAACFTCAGCNRQLGGEFCEDDGKPYHEEW